MKQLSLSLQDIVPLMEQAFLSGSEVHLTIRGNSMSPFLYDGRDIAVFAPLNGRKIRKGDIIFYQRTSGQYVMHRVYTVDATGVMTLLGDAQWTLEPGIRPDQVRAYVPRVIRKGKEINCQKGFYRTLMTLWQLRVRFPRLARICQRLMRLPFGLKRQLKKLLH